MNLQLDAGLTFVERKVYRPNRPTALDSRRSEEFRVRSKHGGP